ncbi:hypothetical protein CTI12_AA220240 [Artemisia annua]|uniref:Uncharacterized protein n=1 Tax=Artemisia annua TaxID=35608 RepID=A0A2U1NWP2_ARTAN|nr:hypothetical protein CTI12_AA220240 [Artemisia annua]
MVEYVKAKYGYSWLESDEMSDEMFKDLCRFAKEEEVIKDTNSKGKEVDASHAQPVSTLGNKSPKPSKMVTNVVLGLLAAKEKKKWSPVRGSSNSDDASIIVEGSSLSS